MAGAMIHLLAGGPGGDHRVLVTLLQQAFAAARLRAPRIAYLGAASGDHAGFFRRVSSLLQSAGAGSVTLAPTCGQRTAAAVATTLEQADAVFMSGGDVEAGMRTLQAAGIIPALRERFAAGTPFLGLSAGSIMLGSQWIAWDDPQDDASAHLFDCLNLAPLVCDTHAEEDDWVELHAALALLPAGTPGYGITANAMLRVHPDGTTEDVGGEIVRAASLRTSATVKHAPHMQRTSADSSGTA